MKKKDEEALCAFARWVMQESFQAIELDPAEVQDKARKLGIVVEVPYDPKVHGESEYDYEPGEPWMILAPFLRK